MDGYLLNPLVFLIRTLAGLYILIVLLRFLLQLVRADFYNPLSQFIVRATNPLVRPLRRVIPGLGGLDLATLVLALVLQLATVAVLELLVGRGSLAPGYLLVLACAELVSLTIWVFFFSILIQALLSWVSHGPHPLGQILWRLNEPILRPLRRFIPAVSGIDLSSLAALLGLQVLNMLVTPPLMMLAQSLR